MKIWNSFKPSMRAASSVSLGKLRALFLKYIIKNGVAMLGIMKPAQELMSFAFVNIWNSGTRTATNGTIIASIRIAMTVSFALS